jgi:hypothetical protein
MAGWREAMRCELQRTVQSAVAPGQYKVTAVLRTSALANAHAVALADAASFLLLRKGRRSDRHPPSLPGWRLRAAG